MPVNHFSRPATFRALNRKAHGMHRHRTTALWVEQQHNMDSAANAITDDPHPTPLPPPPPPPPPSKNYLKKKKKKARGLSLLFWPVLFGWTIPQDIYRNYLFPFPKPKGRLEDCKAWIRACVQPQNQTLDQQHNMVCLCQVRGSGANAAWA